MLKNFIKTAARHSGKKRMMSLMHLPGLDIGVRVGILFFSWISNELSFDNSHKGSQDIYRIKSYSGLGHKEVRYGEQSLPFC